MGSLAGTLNTSVTAGKKTPVDFVVGNAGTAPVRNLSFVTKKPSDKWTVEFKPDKIDALEPGQVREIKMEILAPDRTIAGDYLMTLTANSPEVTKSVEFRVTVSTPTIWGWIGFGIVGLVVLGLGHCIFPLRSSMSTVVDTKDLSKRYREKLAVNALNLTIQEGEIFGFLGPNGAGKTTTILMLLGLTEPTSGASLGVRIQPDPRIYGSQKTGRLSAGESRLLRRSQRARKPALHGSAQSHPGRGSAAAHLRGA